MRKIIVALCLLSGTVNLLAQPESAALNGNFPPPTDPPVVRAERATGKIKLDGVLDEPSWQLVDPVTNFFRMEPQQGGPVRYPTEVRVLYDDTNLYFGVFCADSLGARGVRVQDFRRDFIYGENDVVYLQLDPQNLRRYCVSFQTTPLGTQRDLQDFNDEIKDNDWDALWRVKTRMAEYGWYAEFAVPFKSLRYEQPAENQPVVWGFTAARLARRDYEQTVFPAIPQAYSPYRMTYAARLEGVEVPKPSVNLRVQPYALGEWAQTAAGGAANVGQRAGKVGGDAKWAMNPHAVFDLTVNTDFAQADVDRAVNNLTRFNVFFPERRQFFLENSGIYPADGSDIRPYFSRTIGLSNSQFNAEAVPINAGLRFNDRNLSRAWSGMYVHQRSTSQQGGAHFGLVRYQKNLGSQSNVGVLVTHRYDQPAEQSAQNHNTTATFDGLWRPNDQFQVNGLVSVSRDQALGYTGSAGSLYAGQNNNRYYWGWVSKWVSEQYTPGMGFVFQNNVTYHNPGGYYIWRPKWASKWVRRMDPGAFFNLYHDAWSGKFQQASIYLFPVYVFFSDNSFLEYSLTPTWQRIDFQFDPLNIRIPERDYYYLRHRVRYNSDESRRFSVNTGLETGDFYNGRLTTLNLSTRLAPLPHLAFTAEYEYNAARRLGDNATNADVQLWTGSVRLAANPHLQGQVFYQYNSLDRRARWNARVSWEYQPLSFLFLVFNDTRTRAFDPAGIPSVRNTAVIGKVSWMRQI
jgi:hypothetical protein